MDTSATTWSNTRRVKSQGKWVAETGGRMPRVEGAGDICLRRPRPTQGFRADDDDEPWESLVMCWTKFGLYLSVKVNRFYTVLRRCTGDIFLCAIGNDLCKDPKITKIFSLRFKKILYQWLQTLISFSKNRTRHIMWAIQSYLNVKSTAIYKL